MRELSITLGMQGGLHMCTSMGWPSVRQVRPYRDNYPSMQSTRSCFDTRFYLR
jgi:hypothetical protein